MSQDPPEAPQTWLLLIHQIPPKPSYFRVKIWRRLQKLGAIAIKNSVYALPQSDQAQEDLQWVLREITGGGGDASLIEARFLDGLSDDQVVTLFEEARNADFGQLAEEASTLLEGLPETLDPERRLQLEGEVGRLKRRLRETTAIDYFDASGGKTAAGLLSGLEERLRPSLAPTAGRRDTGSGYEGRTWVTRNGIQVDRIASAWLIRRFIDPGARFKFVQPRGYKPAKGEIRFDMFEAEYTHEGEECSFEVILRRLGPDDAALKTIAEIIHDIDVKDGKFGRPEAVGVERMLEATAMREEDDERLARGSTLLDDLYELYKKMPG